MNLIQQRRIFWSKWNDKGKKMCIFFRRCTLCFCFLHMDFWSKMETCFLKRFAVIQYMLCLTPEAVFIEGNCSRKELSFLRKPGHSALPLFNELGLLQKTGIFTSMQFPLWIPPLCNPATLLNLLMYLYVHSCWTKAFNLAITSMNLAARMIEQSLPYRHLQRKSFHVFWWVPLSDGHLRLKKGSLPNTLPFLRVDCLTNTLYKICLQFLKKGSLPNTLPFLRVAELIL